MNRKKFDYIFLVFFAVTIIFAFVLGSRMGCTLEERTQYGSAEKTTMMFDGADGDYYYEFTLPDEDVSGKNLAFNTSHLYSEVFINGEKIYSCLPDENKTHSTGYRWNFIKLNYSDSGGNVVIHQMTPYKGVIPDPDLYYGEVSDIYKHILRTDGLRMTIAAAVFLMGIMLFLYSAVVLRFSYSDSVPVFFSVASILLSVWAFTNARAFTLIFPAAHWGSLVNHYALMLMPIAFLQFLRQIYYDKDIIVWDFMEYLGAGIVLIRTVLDLFNVYELRETLWYTQLYLFMFAVVGVLLGIREFLSRNVGIQFRFNVLCLIIVLMSAFADLINLKLFNKDTIFGIFCFMFYVVIMSLHIIKQSMKIKERASEAEVYRQLAFTDELTGVFNRTAFRNDLEKYFVSSDDKGEKEIQQCVVFMFDLNDLKKCNDEFGHEKGDEYIVSVSSVLSDVFGVDGRCYRMGGDEFSVIMPFSSYNDIDSRINVINRRVTELNRKKFVVTMSVSSGYAVYDSQIDDSLDETMKRADLMMYKNKQKYKESL